MNLGWCMVRANKLLQNKVRKGIPLVLVQVVQSFNPQRAMVSQLHKVAFRHLFITQFHNCGLDDALFSVESPLKLSPKANNNCKYMLEVWEPH